MVAVVNRAAGPRMFQVKGAAPGAAIAVTLLPGESGDLDLVSENDRVLQGWVEADEVLVGADAEKYLSRRKMPVDALVKRQAELRAELASLDAQMPAVDPVILTPPHQFGGDGGPEQMPTVDGVSGGAPTPAQGEGTAEQKHAPNMVAALPVGEASAPPADAPPPPHVVSVEAKAVEAPPAPPVARGPGRPRNAV